VKVVLSRGARREIREAHDRYELERPGLGARFEAELEEVLALATVAPLAGSPVGASGLRRMLLDDFPYDVVYRTTAAGLRVVAVAHQKRRPGYWRARRDRGE
jgi:toxin ParE1/3/4